MEMYWGNVYDIKYEKGRIAIGFGAEGPIDRVSFSVKNLYIIYI